MLNAVYPSLPEMAPRLKRFFAGFPKQSGVGLIETCRVVCDDQRDGVWPSDHFGVYAELRTEPLAGRVDDRGLTGGDDVRFET